MSKFLTNKQQAFIREYLVDFNATKAAGRAGTKGSPASLAVIGFENLRKDKIYDAIKGRLGESSMLFQEVLFRLTRHARGTMADFLSPGSDGACRLDLARAAQNDALDLVERLEFHEFERPDGGVQKRTVLKHYSAQRALIHIGKAFDLWKGDMRMCRYREDGELEISLSYPKPPEPQGFRTVDQLKQRIAEAWEETALYGEWIQVRQHITGDKGMEGHRKWRNSGQLQE